MNYGLPKSLEVCGQEYEIRSDYRAVLDICTALSDIELDDSEKALTALWIFYPQFEAMPYEHYQEALEKCFWFINGGEDDTSSTKKPKLMDWEQDFKYVIAPINKFAGTDIRGVEYLHWWTFLSYYMEIGDCLFAQIVNIRNKKAKGKKLTKEEKEWYRENKSIVDIKTKYSDAEEELLSKWLGGETANG